MLVFGPITKISRPTGMQTANWIICADSLPRRNEFELRTKVDWTEENKSAGKPI